MCSEEMTYTPAMLARLAYSHAAYELSERLVSEAGTYADEYGRGAFLSEEAATIVSDSEGAAGGSGRRRQAARCFMACGRGGSRSIRRGGAGTVRFSRAAVPRGAVVPAPAPREREASGTQWRRPPSKSPIACESNSTLGSSGIAAVAGRIATSQTP